MFVSGYGNDLIDALIKDIDNPDDDAPVRRVEERVKGRMKKAMDEAYDDFLSVVQDCLTMNMSDAIRDAVSRTAGKLVESMLAGDEETFGELFQFRHDWQGSSYFDGLRGDLPLGVELRRKLLTKHHDLFESKAIADLEGELAALKRYHKLGAWRTMVAGDIGVESTEAAP